MELYFSNDSKFSFADVQDMDTQPSPSLANMRQPDLKIIIDNSMDDKLDSPSILSSKDPVGEIAMYVEKIKNLARKKRVSGNLWEYNTCHSCRGLLENKLLLHCSEEECSRYFCLRCMNKKYSTSCQDIYNIMKMGKWTCFSCSGICNCKICKDRFLDKGNPFFPNQLIKFEKSKRRGPRANNPAKPNEETSTEITNKLEQVQDISSQENSHTLPLELKPNKSSDNVEGEALYKPEVEKNEKVEKIEQVQKIEKVEKVYKIERVVPKAPKAEKVETKEKVDKAEKVDKVFQVQKPEKAEKKEKKEKAPKGEKADKPEKVKKLRKVEKNEKGEKVEKADKPEKTKKIQKVALDQKPFKIEKLETVEKVVKTEQVQKVEKPEKIEEEVPKVEVVKKIELQKTELKDDLFDLDDMIMITIHKNLHARSKGIARKNFRENQQVLETSSVGEELVDEKLIKDIPIKEIEKMPVNEDFLNPDKIGKRGSRGIRKKLAEECHLCGKSLPGVLVAVCSVDKCHKAFCELCIHENFQQDFSAKNYNPDCWICYACGGACKCPKCGRKRVLGFKVESDDMLQRNIKKSQIKPIEKRRPKFYDPIAEEEYAMPTHIKPSNKAQTSMDVEFTAHGTTEEPQEMIQAFEKIINKKRRLNKPVPVLTKQNIDNSKIISEFDIDSACITLYTAENEDELKMGL